MVQSARTYRQNERYQHGNASFLVQPKPTKTVDTLGLVGANYNAAESRAFLEQENGVRITTLRLAIAATRATVVASVLLRGGESGSSLDSDRRAKGGSCRWLGENVRSRAALQAIRDALASDMKS